MEVYLNLFIILLVSKYKCFFIKKKGKITNLFIYILHTTSNTKLLLKIFLLYDFFLIF